MRSNSSLRPLPADSCNDSSILPRSSSFVKMPRAGGQVPTQIEAPASASALAIAKPKPPSSATPATNARFPVRSIFSIGRSPAHGRASPRESGAERGEHQQVAACQAAGGERFVERDGDRGRGGVAVFLDVDVDLVVAESQRLLYHLEDPQVRLMGHKQLHVRGRQ